MSLPITLHQAVSDGSRQRINPFPGRHLSEHSFDLMQSYVDGRVAPLLASAYPGIVEGLQLTNNHRGDKLQIRVQPGTAIGVNGNTIRVFYPIDIDWPELIETHQAHNSNASDIPHGFYFLTIRQGVAVLEDDADARPCTRDEADPLRDSRIETYTSLDLQYITALSSLMSASETRASNALCVRHLNQPVFDRQTGAVPIAIVKIEHGQAQWFDETAGRYLAQKDAAYKTFARHWNKTLDSNSWGNEGSSLRQLLGVDYLPAAGQIPTHLLSAIAGAEIAPDSDTAGSRTDWALPKLHFDSKDLQIELLPVPANSVQGILQRELPRGFIDLAHAQGDRLRIMVAVEDDKYRADLMNLPSVDQALIHDLFTQAQTAIQAEHDWAYAHRNLYQNLDDGLLINEGRETLGDSALELFNNTYLVAGYSTEQSPDYPSISEKQREQLGIPNAIHPARTAEKFFSDLKKNTGRPYSNTQTPTPPGTEPPAFEASDEDGLYRQIAILNKQIETLEENLEAGFDLIDEVNDFVGVQRQHLDSITTSFAALAGGVAGDGSGLKLMRWSGDLRFNPKELEE